MALDKQKLDNMQNKLDLTERRETEENSLGLQKSDGVKGSPIVLIILLRFLSRTAS